MTSCDWCDRWVTFYICLPVSSTSSAWIAWQYFLLLSLSTCCNLLNWVMYSDRSLIILSRHILVASSTVHTPACLEENRFPIVNAKCLDACCTCIFLEDKNSFWIPPDGSLHQRDLNRSERMFLWGGSKQFPAPTVYMCCVSREWWQRLNHWLGSFLIPWL